jgi:hypothetical protein
MTRSKNYNSIECVAAMAATLNVYENGDTEHSSERNQLCAQKYLQHIDHLVASTEMVLTPHSLSLWPRWPENVSVEYAKKRAERPDLLWKRGLDTIAECRKYEGILTNLKQRHGGHYPSGWKREDVIHYLKEKLWEAEEKEKKKSVNLVDEDSPGNVDQSPSQDIPRPMPCD